jgi:chemotaxis protein CheX
MSAAPKMESKNPLFDKRLINAFVDGVIKTLKTMAYTEVTPGKPFIEPKFIMKGEIAGMVGMVAPPIKGTFLICFDKPAIFAILENMIGEVHTELNSDVSDGVGEMTNMIYGAAKTTLNELGYKFEMAIPSVITGISGAFSISHGRLGATLVIPFNLPNGTIFYIEIAVE